MSTKNAVDKINGQSFRFGLCVRKYPIGSFESNVLGQLFEIYKKNKSFVILRLEENSHVMIVKYFQLINHVGGISSLTEDDFHVGFIDVDDYSLKKLKIRLKKTQEEFDLSSFYILKSSSKSYHCICLDKHTFGFWIDALKYFDNDSTMQYQRFALSRNRFVLRITPKAEKEKPELICILKRFNYRTKSKAHYNFLRLRYEIPKIRFLDFYSKIMVEDYQTVVK